MPAPIPTPNPTLRPRPRAEVIVLGAGMVGIGTALALQARGHAVTVVDRHAAAGRETSFGNAGVLQAEAMEPYAMPRDLATLARYAMGATNDLRWHLRDLPAALPALVAYYKASAPHNHATAAQSYAQMIARGVADHAAYIAAADCADLVRSTGLGELYRSEKAFEKAMEKATRLQARYGVALRLLSGAQVQREEAALTCPGAAADAPPLAGAVIWPDTWSTRDPAALTAAYARLFTARGGEIRQGDAATLRAQGAGWQVQTAIGAVRGSDVVVALGPWSPDLLQTLGYKIPMIWKRGYHQHYATPQSLTRPYLDAQNGIVLSSMALGLRITTGAEIVRRDAPADLCQLLRGRRAAGELIEFSPDAPQGDQPPKAPWIGHRPCLPRMLPMVGPAPATRGAAPKGLWFNFGHGHQGLTLGPTTGHILADLFEGETSALSQALAP